jgi:hypothetical protein
MTFLLTPKITAMQTLITISNTPESNFTSGTSLKEDTNISTIIHVSKKFCAYSDYGAKKLSYLGKYRSVISV